MAPAWRLPALGGRGTRQPSVMPDLIRYPPYFPPTPDKKVDPGSSPGRRLHPPSGLILDSAETADSIAFRNFLRLIPSKWMMVRSSRGLFMGGFDLVLTGGAFVMREAALFAACGFLLLGLSDLLVDLIWLGLRLFRRRRATSFPVADRPGRLAIFLPAWDEAAVIGAMLAHTQAALRTPAYPPSIS